MVSRFRMGVAVRRARYVPGRSDQQMGFATLEWTISTNREASQERHSKLWSSTSRRSRRAATRPGT